MSFKIGHESLIPISNLKKPAKEEALKAHDTKQADGVLDMEEASSFMHAQNGTQPLSAADVYRKAGGRQHAVTLLASNYGATIDGTGAYNHKGNFHVDGLGAGNVSTGRLKTDRKVDAYAFSINCDMIDKAFLDGKIASANIMVGPKDFKPEAGSSQFEQIAIPLNIATKDGYSYQTYNRGGGGGTVTVPDKKMLGARVDTKALAKLAGDSGGLSFYVRIDTVDGKTVWLNKDGVSGRNFEIDAAELRANPT